MTEILSYAVYRIELDEIENSDDWFDANGRLKYKEQFLFDTLKDAVEFCEGAGLSKNSDYFYFCLRAEATATVSEGEYVEVGY